MENMDLFLKKKFKTFQIAAKVWQKFHIFLKQKEAANSLIQFIVFSNK